jgi:hypothetical protein
MGADVAVVRVERLLLALGDGDRRRPGCERTLAIFALEELIEITWMVAADVGGHG